MYISLVLQFRAGLLILIWMTFLASGSLFAVLVYYPEMGYAGSGVAVGNDAYANCNGDMITVFFYSIFQKSMDSHMQERLQFSSGQDHL